jgi:NAD(P)-dependent dehydrogenase (short-subunit alcohol dehydrogenase family)
MFIPSSLPSLVGKIFIVTGGNTGIGYATCLNVVAKGGRVYMGARSSSKADAAIAKIKETHPDADLHVLITDNASLNTVVKAAKHFISQESQLHGLILNAGIMAVPYAVTSDGFESQMQVNYLAHWLLTCYLLPTLQSTARKEGPGSVRIVSVSSEGHQKSPFGVTKILYDTIEIEKFGNFGNYGLSKLANVLHAKSLHSQYGPRSENAKQGKGEIWTGSLHPGFIDSQLNEVNRDNTSWKLSWIHPVLRFFRIIRPWDEEGCISSLFVVASPEFTAEMSGLYFNEKATVKEPNPAAKDVVEQEKLESWTKEVMKKGGCNIWGFSEQTFRTTFFSQTLNGLVIINEVPEKKWTCWNGNEEVKSI